MKQIITGQDRRVERFVADRIGMNGSFGSCSTIGLEGDGELVAGVVYAEFNTSNVCMHVGAIGKRWMNREYLWFCFYYPFEQLKVKRVTAVVDDANKDSINFVTKLGFELEAKLEDAGRSGDLLIYRMFKKDCRFLGIK